MLEAQPGLATVLTGAAELLPAALVVGAGVVTTHSVANEGQQSSTMLQALSHWHEAPANGAWKQRSSQLSLATGPVVEATRVVVLRTEAPVVEVGAGVVVVRHRLA